MGHHAPKEEKKAPKKRRRKKQAEKKAAPVPVPAAPMPIPPTPAPPEPVVRVTPAQLRSEVTRARSAYAMVPAWVNHTGEGARELDETRVLECGKQLGKSVSQFMQSVGTAGAFGVTLVKQAVDPKEPQLAEDRARAIAEWSALPTLESLTPKVKFIGHRAMARMGGHGHDVPGNPLPFISAEIGHTVELMRQARELISVANGEDGPATVEEELLATTEEADLKYLRKALDLHGYSKARQDEAGGDDLRDHLEDLQTEAEMMSFAGQEIPRERLDELQAIAANVKHEGSGYFGREIAALDEVEREALVAALPPDQLNNLLVHADDDTKQILRGTRMGNGFDAVDTEGRSLLDVATSPELYGRMARAYVGVELRVTGGAVRMLGDLPVVGGVTRPLCNVVGDGYDLLADGADYVTGMDDIYEQNPDMVKTRKFFEGMASSAEAGIVKSLVGGELATLDTISDTYDGVKGAAKLFSGLDNLSEAYEKSKTLIDAAIKVVRLGTPLFKPGDPGQSIDVALLSQTLDAVIDALSTYGGEKTILAEKKARDDHKAARQRKQRRDTYERVESGAPAYEGYRGKERAKANDRSEGPVEQWKLPPSGKQQLEDFALGQVVTLVKNGLIGVKDALIGYVTGNDSLGTELVKQLPTFVSETAGSIISSGLNLLIDKLVGWVESRFIRPWIDDQPISVPPELYLPMLKAPFSFGAEQLTPYLKGLIKDAVTDWIGPHPAEMGKQADAAIDAASDFPALDPFAATEAAADVAPSLGIDP